MLERKNLTLSLSDVCIKASGEGYSFEGYASKFNGVDTYGDTILPGAYKNVVKEARVSGRMPKMFFNHKSYDLPIGKWRKVEEDDDGLLVVGNLTKGMSIVEDIKLAMAEQTLDGLSVGIGLKSDDYEWVDDPKSSISRIIKNVSSLREISLVSFPADDGGRVDMSSIKAELDSVQSLSDLEMFLREAGGFSKSAATAVVSRAKSIFRGDPATSSSAKSVEEQVNAFLESSGLRQTLTL
jgi:hypothetical protein